jgi:hypothetical protein
MAGLQAAGEAGGFPQHTSNQPSPTSDQLTDKQLTALELLLLPFDAHQISRRPEITCRPCGKADTRRCAQHEKSVCPNCGTYVTEAHIDLDYVGHAEATARLLAVDPLYTWTPMARTERGLPLFDEHGGLWITLTVAGMSRIGYGDAPYKGGSQAVKEVIGDAIRNAAMRYGMALDLWKPGARVAVEPSAAAKILERLAEPAVRGNLRALEEMRRRAAQADVLEHVSEAAGWRTIVEVIDDLVAALTRPPLGPLRPQQTPTAAGVEGPADAQQAGMAFQVAAKVEAGRNNLLACEQTLVEVRRRDLAAVPYPGDERQRTFAQVLEELIAGLRQSRSGSRSGQEVA